MAVLTQKEETAKKARVDKGVGAMKTPDKPTGTLRHISIRPAENGYSVDVDRDTPAEKSESKGKGDSPMTASYQPPKQHVFGGKDAKQQVLDHIAQHMD